MAQPKSKVVFRYGTRADYDALVAKDPKSLYFLLDTHELYRGNVPVGVAHYYEGIKDPNFDVPANILRILDGNTPVTNDLMILVDRQLGTQDIYVYTVTNQWKHLNARFKSTSVILSDGKTLDEALATLKIDINEKVFEFKDDVLSLKNYQKQYYHFVPEVAAQGTQGDPDYVEAVPAHYELVTVDNEHPWPAGLSPRVEDNGSLGWYEPDTSILEGLRQLENQLQTDVGRIDDLEDRVGDLETLVGTVGAEPELDPVNGDIITPGTESTGLIKKVENLEELLASGIQDVYVDGALLDEDEHGAVNIPAFDGTHAGVLPGLDTTVSSLAEEEKRLYHLDANGTWSNVIGDLTFNSQVYNTVSEYVDARVEDGALRWEEITE